MFLDILQAQTKTLAGHEYQIKILLVTSLIFLIAWPTRCDPNPWPPFSINQSHRYNWDFQK